MANSLGSTLFMPVGDANEQVLGLMAMALANGNVLVDDIAGRPAGDPTPFLRSGLLDESKRVPLTVLPWRDAKAIKQGVTPYSEEFADCLTDVAQYVYDTYGKFPNTFTTMVLSGFVQAVHLDTDFYDTHCQSGAYLKTHARHMERWHEDDAGS